MKQLTALEISCILKELQYLINLKLSRVYQPAKKEIVLIFHKPSEGKVMLRILPGYALYLASSKTESPKEQFNFCKFLRKRIENSRLTGISQNNFERILEFCFEKKGEKYYLIVEFFSKGNILLCSQDHTILSAMQVQHWKDRTIKAKETYQYPPKNSKNIMKISFEDFRSAVKDSKKDSIVKILASDLGLGSLYAEEICARAGIDKNAKESLEEVYAEIQKLKKEEISARLYKEEATPFVMKTFQNQESQSFPTFSEALNKHFPQFEQPQKNVYEEKTLEQQRIAETQKQQIASLERDISINKEKGDIIYQNYQYMKEIITTIRMARAKKFSWEEIKEKLKTKNIQVIGKEGKVEVELK